MKVAQSCPTLCDPMDYTTHGILQARILEWVAFPFFQGSNPGFLHRGWILYQLSHKGSQKRPTILHRLPWLALRHGEGNGTPLQCSCLENPMDGGAWWATVHGVEKSWTGLSNFTFTFHCHALEKEMATHSSVPAWRIPGTGEPGGLTSVGSRTVGHD